MAQKRKTQSQKRAQPPPRRNANVNARTAANKKPAPKREPEEIEERNGTLLRPVLIVFLIFAILAGAGVGGYYLYRHFKRDVPIADELTVTVGSTEYSQNATALAIYSGDEIKVNSSDFTVTITANADGQNDFPFLLDSEPWQWSQIAGKDFSEAFAMTKTQTGFTVRYDSLAALVSAAYGGRSVTLDEAEIRAQELFTLTIRSGGDILVFTFTVGTRPQNIVIDPGHVTLALWLRTIIR